jgi:uncharacterized RDD family membrane protein YckC
MNEPRFSLDGTYSVTTPEYVEFNFVLAGLTSRFLAWAIDTVVTLMATMAVGTVIALLSPFAQGFAQALYLGLHFVIDWGYFIVLEAVWSGQTVGKRAMGLRVLQESGVRVGLYQSLVRNLIRPIDRFPIFYLLGGAAALLSERHQRLGDLLAGTVVVRERRLQVPASLTRPQGDTALLSDIDFRARVAKLSTDEEQLLLSAAMRREELSIEARLTLFAALSTRLQDENGFFKPEHLSDEKLVLLVSAALAAKHVTPKKKHVSRATSPGAVV